MAQIVRQGFENAKANEREFGGRESEERFSKEKIDSDGLTGQERARFYDAIDNNRKGLMVGSNAVLLIDDSPNDSYISDYTLICWYGDKISPSIKAIYKISGFDYNIYNPKMNLINSLVEMEAKGVNVDFIRKALRDSLLDSKAVFKRYNRKTNRYNTLTKTNRANNQYPSQNNQAQTNGTGVSGQAKGGVPRVQGSKQLNDKKPTDRGNLSDKAGSLKSKDDTISLSAVERGDMETAQRMVDEAPEVFSEAAKKKKAL